MNETLRLWRHISGGVLGAIAGIVIAGYYDIAWATPFLAALGGAIGFWPEYVLVGAFTGIFTAWLHTYIFFHDLWRGVRLVVHIGKILKREIATGIMLSWLITCYYIRMFLDGLNAFVPAIVRLFKQSKRRPVTIKALRRRTWLYITIYAVLAFGLLAWVYDSFLPATMLEYAHMGRDTAVDLGPPNLVTRPFSEAVAYTAITFAFFVLMPVIFILEDTNERKHIDTFRWVQHANKVGSVRAAMLPVYRLAKINLLWIPMLPLLLIFGIIGIVAYLVLAGVFGAIRGLYTAFTKHGGYVAVGTITIVTSISGWLWWDAIVADQTIRWVIALATGLFAGGMSYTATTLLSQIELSWKVLREESAWKASASYLDPVLNRITKTVNAKLAKTAIPAFL